MRKFVIECVEDGYVIKERDETGAITELYRGDKIKFWPDTPKYDIYEMAKINAVNQILVEKNEPPMTDPEMLFLVDPFSASYPTLTAEDIQAADLQRLAGFSIEKKVVYLDTQE